MGAAISGLTSKILEQVLTGQPPLERHAFAWTGIPQSFIDLAGEGEYCETHSLEHTSGEVTAGGFGSFLQLSRMICTMGLAHSHLGHLLAMRSGKIVCQGYKFIGTAKDMPWHMKVRRDALAMIFCWRTIWEETQWFYISPKTVYRKTPMSPTTSSNFLPVKICLLRPRGLRLDGFWIIMKEGLRKRHIKTHDCLALGMRTQKAMRCPHLVVAPLVENCNAMRTTPTVPQNRISDLIKFLQSCNEVDITRRTDHILLRHPSYYT